MFQFMVNAEGGLTTAGYVVCVIAGIVLFGLAIFFAGKSSDRKKITTRQLVFCAMAVALAFTAGYVVCVIAGIVLFGLAIFFAGKSSDRKKITTRQLVFCAMAVALAFVTSYMKLFHLPWGGSVTLCSMLFIVLTANWYGPKTGVMVGLAYGILQ